MTLRVAGKWLGYVVASTTLVTVMVTSLTYVFATKEELIQVEQAQVKVEADTKLRDFRIQRLEVRLENVEAIAQRTDKNVEKLLLLRRLEPAPKAKFKPLPRLPAPDNLWAVE